MNHRFGYLMVAGLALAAAPQSTTSASSVPHPVPNVEILVDGVVQRRYAHDGRWYVEALKGREYAIRLRNPYGVRVAVAMSVDGLNTIDARETTAAGARKWVLGPHETVTISGWQTSSTARSAIRVHDRRSIVRSGPRQNREPWRHLGGLLQGAREGIRC